MRSAVSANSWNARNQKEMRRREYYEKPSEIRRRAETACRSDAQSSPPSSAGVPPKSNSGTGLKIYMHRSGDFRPPLVNAHAQHACSRPARKKRSGVPSSVMLSPLRSICPGHFPQSPGPAMLGRTWGQSNSREARFSTIRKSRTKSRQANELALPRGSAWGVSQSAQVGQNRRFCGRIACEAKVWSRPAGGITRPSTDRSSMTQQNCPQVTWNNSPVRVSPSTSTTRSRISTSPKPSNTSTPGAQATPDRPAGICGPIGPTEQLPLVARLVNELEIDLRHAHFWGMDEWVPRRPRGARVLPAQLRASRPRVVFNRIKPHLAMPEKNIHFPTAESGRIPKELGRKPAAS